MLEASFLPTKKKKKKKKRIPSWMIGGGSDESNILETGVEMEAGVTTRADLAIVFNELVIAWKRKVFIDSGHPNGF